jgi:tetratricopeptide (TPR) repeat protein
MLLRSKETLDEAEMYLTRAFDVNPQQQDGLIALGRVKEKKGDVDQAIKFYEMALQIPGNHTYPLMYLGIIYAKKKDDH